MSTDIKQPYKSFARPFLITLVAILFCMGAIEIYLQTKASLQEKLRVFGEDVEIHIGRAVNNLGLIARLSTVQTSLRFGTSEPVEKVLNQSIRDEEFIEYFAVLDKSKKLFASNVFQATGAYSGTPVDLISISWSELALLRVISEKYGELEVGSSAGSDRLQFFKKISEQDEQLGYAVTSIAYGSLFSRLKARESLPDYLSPQLFISAAPLGWKCVQGRTIEQISICAHIGRPEIFQAARAPMLLLFLFCSFVGIVLALLLALAAKDAQKELAVQKALVSLATQVAHDIRSPLAALQIGIKTCDTESDSRQMMIDSIQRIKSIANDLLDAYRKKENAFVSLPVENLRASLMRVVREVVAEKRVEYRSNLTIKCFLEISEDSDPQLNIVEAPKLARIVSNLINNAYESISGSGSVHVRVFQNPQHWTIQVQDTGKGIPSDILPRILERGFSHGKSGGSGLGLSRANEVIKTWSGHLTIESQVNLGTIITITLPSKCLLFDANFNKMET
jgi:signal transduction histidine kinase